MCSSFSTSESASLFSFFGGDLIRPITFSIILRRQNGWENIKFSTNNVLFFFSYLLNVFVWFMLNFKIRHDQKKKKKWKWFV